MSSTAIKPLCQIRDICEIRSGFSARGRLELSDTSGVPIIQLRDIGEKPLNIEELGRAGLKDVNERYWVGEDDIVFRTRFEPNTAVHLSDFSGRAVLMSPLVVLRLMTDAVLPEYLTWFIGQAPAQRHFDRCARGTKIRMVPMDCLKRLEVPVPDVEIQRMIAKISCLAEREGEIMEQLIRKRRQFTSFALLELARKIKNVTPPAQGFGKRQV